MNENQKSVELIEPTQSLPSQESLANCKKIDEETLALVGMTNAHKIFKARRYYEISMSKIESFLVKKIKEVSLEKLETLSGVKKNFTKPEKIDNRIAYKMRFGEDSNNYHHSSLYWIETEIKNYNAVPPAFVIEKLKEAKALEVFDKFVIATLETKFDKVEKVQDPLLLGIMNNNTSRYLIAQWDNDLILDDIV